MPLCGPTHLGAVCGPHFPSVYDEIVPLCRSGCLDACEGKQLSKRSGQLLVVLLTVTFRQRPFQISTTPLPKFTVTRWAFYRTTHAQWNFGKAAVFLFIQRQKSKAENPIISLGSKRVCFPNNRQTRLPVLAVVKLIFKYYPNFLFTLAIPTP